MLRTVGVARDTSAQWHAHQGRLRVTSARLARGRNDLVAGVAISPLEGLSHSVAPGGFIMGQRFPAWVLCIRLRTRGSHDVLLVNAYVPHALAVRSCEEAKFFWFV